MSELEVSLSLQTVSFGKTTYINQTFKIQKRINDALLFKGNFQDQMLTDCLLDKKLVYSKNIR